MAARKLFLFFFFFNDTATTEIYPLPLPDALPISPPPQPAQQRRFCRWAHPGDESLAVVLGWNTVAQGIHRWRPVVVRESGFQEWSNDTRNHAGHLFLADQIRRRRDGRWKTSWLGPSRW